MPNAPKNPPARVARLTAAPPKGGAPGAGAPAAPAAPGGAAAASAGDPAAGDQGATEQAAADVATERDRIPADARAVLARFGARASQVKVWRYSDERGSYEYVRLIPAAEFNEERLQQRYGGGQYRGDVIDGAGRHLGSVPPFAIAGDALALRPAPGAAAAAAAPDVASQLAPMFAALIDGQRAIAEALARVGTAQPAAAGIDQVVAIARALRDLAPAPAAAAAGATTPAGTPLAQVRELLQVSELLGRGSNAPDWALLVREGVQPVVGLMREHINLSREQMHLRRRPPAAPAAAAAAAPAPAGAALATAAGDPLAPLLGALSPWARSFLLDCAASDKDPALYAELVLDKLPGEVFDALPQLLAAPDVGARVVALVPEWEPFRDWFVQLVDALRESRGALAPAADDASGATS